MRMIVVHPFSRNGTMNLVFKMHVFLIHVSHARTFMNRRGFFEVALVRFLLKNITNAPGSDMCMIQGSRTHV